MRTLFLCLCIAPFLSLSPYAVAEEMKSPDGELTMTEAQPVDSEEIYQLQRITLRRGTSILWEYASSCRKLRFQWAADSRHCLIAQVNGGRDMSLFMLSIDPDFSPRLQELDLHAVDKKIIEPIPEYYNRPGGSAPVSLVNWESIKWVEPTKCEMTYIKKSVGLDSEARLQVELGEDRSELTVLEITDKMAAKLKAGEKAPGN
ncbi:MAG: hypothetical protein EOP85_19840 [Verrucomicrobiaceae bacterium]|nr:MAG: hypothetical protein EOP85_19840 [Verrucomicrobiaceae bacterium]